jgi:rhodanese-related sulfurtransferase
MARLVPCKGVRIVLCDDTGQRAALAARTLERMGYRDVAILEGGINLWSSQGYPTEWGLNVPSKDFGERVEVEHHVPTIEAADLQRRIAAGERLVILDTRTPEEYGQWCIPGGRSVPGGELAYRVGEIVRQDPEATVVINCAGRTRSIIGARVLQRMGLPNVISLKNGTSGWVLAGLQLETGARRMELPEPSEATLAAAEAFAVRVAAEDGVRFLDVPALRDLMARAEQECVYLVDVRTEGEFAAGHIPGFWWFPGGQAVQRCDDLVAVRNAAVVFSSDDKVRAAVTASWYRQLGFPNVYALQDGLTTWRAAGLPVEEGPDSEEIFGLDQARAETPARSPEQLHASLTADPRPIVLFVDTSRDFATGHVPGARWVSRSWLELQVDSLAPDHSAPVVVSDLDGRSAPLAAATLRDLGYRDVATLAGGMHAWRQAGLPVEQGLSGVMTPPDDVVPAGPARSYADMIHYLRWEEALGRKYAPTG